MSVTPEAYIDGLRQYLGVRFSDQGRGRLTGFDCGGFPMVGARETGILDLEFLGYSRFPRDGKFEELLRANSEFVGEHRKPFRFDGTEIRLADLVSFDYGDGEGTRHLAVVTGWDGRRYRVIEAQPAYGVCEHALAAPFITGKTILKVWRFAVFAK